MSGIASKSAKGAKPYTRLAATLALAAALLLVMKNEETVTAAVKQGLLLCAHTMIPSLFPFMVLAELIVCTGAGQTIARVAGQLLQPLFSVSESGACALAMGMLCGFPVGARTAASYYRRGQMSVREFNHVLCFCNVPSAAFLIGTAGIALFGNAAFGRTLLWLVLGSSAVVGVVWRWLLPHRIEMADSARPVLEARQERSASLLPLAISAAASSMLGVCATVVVFGVMVGMLGDAMEALDMSETWRAALGGIFELSAGVSEAAVLTDRRTAAILCAAVAGWGGLSVHCQIMAVCDGCPLALGYFFAARALSALLTGGGMWLCLALGWLSPDAQTTYPLAAGGAWRLESGEVISLLWVILFALALTLRAVMIWRGREKEVG